MCGNERERVWERERDRRPEWESERASEWASERSASVRERERGSGKHGRGWRTHVKEFSAPLLTLTKCFWPPQAACPTPLPALRPQLHAATARGVAAPALPPLIPYPRHLLCAELSTHMHNCLVYLFAAPSLRSCCAPVGARSLSLARAQSTSRALSLTHALCCPALPLSLSLVLLFVCILVWDFRGIFVAFCLVNRGWLLVNTHTHIHMQYTLTHTRVATETAKKILT